MLQVELPDGSVREYPGSVRPIEIAAEIGPRLAKATLAAQVDGKVVGASRPLPASGRVRLRLLTKKDAEALAVMRHSAAHVMARAVMRLFEGVGLAFGPTIDKGFYYDFDLPHKLSEEDFPRIEAEMARLVKMDEPFERIEEPRDKALEICRDLGQRLKVEHIEQGLADHPTLSFYRQGEIHRSVPRSARSQCRRDRGVQAAVGRRCLLERGCLAAAVAAAVCHGLVQRRRAGGISADGRRSRSAATIACWASSSTCSPPIRMVGPGFDPVAAQGCHDPRLAGKLSRRRSWPAAATSRSTRRTSPGSSCIRFRDTIPTTPTANSSRS